MRIAFVSQEYPPETADGGIGSQTYLKAHGMAARGHEVFVVSRSRDGRPREYDDGAVRVIRIDGGEDQLTGYTELAQWLTYSVQVAAALEELQARHPLDLVDFPEWASEGYVHLLNQCEKNRVANVVQLHGPLVMFAHTMGWPELDSELYRVGREMEHACLRLADRVYSSSECSADWCAREYGLARSCIPTLHTGVDTRLFAPRAVPKADRPTIVFVGKIAANKGVDRLLDAACTLALEVPGLRLRMLGRGAPRYVESLRAQARERGVPDLLELPGYVAREDLPDHLSRAHVFAAPSVYEGGPGFVFLEAMACGLPVVGVAGSGVAEAVRHGDTGLLVEQGDQGALVRTLRALLTSDQLRSELGARARTFVLSHADSELCARRLEAFYDDVVGACTVR